ncbi:MAG: NADPH-dependent F420 reductase [Chloroflexi bacterium]|nr:NADPH-dependent F420 reductase [Chloroflexota bacterium]
MTRVALIGGTGPEGLGLAVRFARAGDEVFIGSRTKERAAEAAAKVKEKVPDARVKGLPNAEAVEKAEMVFLTVPFAAHAETLESLAETIGEKILVDVVVPVEFGEDGINAVTVAEGSAAQQARALVPKAKVASAFHHLDASDLQRIERPMQGDAIVCADHKGAKKKVMEQAEKIEYIRALDGGGLTNSHYLEEWTALLLNINKIYKAHTGVRIVGV